MATDREKSAAPSLGGLGFQQIKDLTVAGLPLEQIQTLSAAGFSFEQLEELAASTPSGGGGLSKSDLAEILKTASEAGSEGMRRVVSPQNARSDGKSAFSYPEGEYARPKPKLRRVAFFCGHREDAEQLTPEEIDLYNRIDGSYTARRGQWTCELKRNGSTEEVHVVVPCKSIDDRMNLPAVSLVIKELLDGQAAVDPLSLSQRIADLEQQLASARA